MTLREKHKRLLREWGAEAFTNMLKKSNPFSDVSEYVEMLEDEIARKDWENETIMYS